MFTVEDGETFRVFWNSGDDFFRCREWVCRPVHMFVELDQVDDGSDASVGFLYEGHRGTPF